MVAVNVRRGSEQFLGFACGAVNEDGVDSCEKGGAVPMAEQDANEEIQKAMPMLTVTREETYVQCMLVPITAEMAVAVPLIVLGLLELLVSAAVM